LGTGCLQNTINKRFTGYIKYDFMKNNLYSQFNKIVVSLAIGVIVIMAGVLEGCQEEKAFDTTPTNLPFLSFSDNIHKNGELLEEDFNVLAVAFQRINLINKDGLYYMVETSAEQINVSKDLFDYLKDMANISNKRILNYGYNSSIPRLKSGTENGYGVSNDCVAQTVFSIANSMGISLSYSSINSWIVANYGTNGVPSSNISEVMNHFFSYSSVSIHDGYVPPSGKQVFVVFNFGNGSGHASRYLGCSGGNVLCSDGFYPISQVSSSYLINGSN
jgi:hypothetical protein